MLRSKIVPGILSALLLSQDCLAQQKVYTYIVEQQKARDETRWTLTEWLRIKERMRLMDLWLALVNDEQAKKFAPELSLSYQQGKAHNDWSLSDPSTSWQDVSLSEGGLAQFWFSNLISSTTGLRTLAIDLGVEGGFHNAKQSQISETFRSWTPHTERLKFWSANFRLFGANVQDSGLVLKLGKYEHRPLWSQGLGEESRGLYQAGELRLYLMNNLGLEGEWRLYQKGSMGDFSSQGWSREAAAFLEFYSLRAGYGISQSSWTYQSEVTRWKSLELDRFFFVRLHF